MASFIRCNRNRGFDLTLLNTRSLILRASPKNARTICPSYSFIASQYRHHTRSTSSKVWTSIRTPFIKDAGTVDLNLRQTRCFADRPPAVEGGPEGSDDKSSSIDRLAKAQTRTKELSQRVKSTLGKVTPHENIYNLPNFLTVTRLFAAPLTAYLLLHDHHDWALGVFAYAGITDLVDGWMARKWKLQTVAGSVIDPMADKALMIILTVTLAVKSAIPAYLATLILGRDAALAIAAIWYRYASLPQPKTMARYWDFSLPSAEVHPTTVSKYNTFLQLILIGSTLALPVITADNHHLGTLHDLGLGNVDLHKAMLYLQILVAGTTAWSGMSYAFLKNAVTILGPNETVKARQGAVGRAIIGVSFGAIVVMAAYLAMDDWLTVDGDQGAEAAEGRVQYTSRRQ